MSVPTPVLYAVIVIWAISAIGLIVFVLLHSGKGTGLSEAIAGSVYGGDTGTSIVEKNLDRITVVFAVIFIICLLVMMVIYPHGSVS
ncbi:MAG: preprotein translocase subunit SecG [Coriobacteriales bacterium]|nr:preprotein translocase subunit SecG [Coriobacteriales bacterium]